MPEDYEGHPQRRDFPIGGEPVLFTHNDATAPAVDAMSTTPEYRKREESDHAVAARGADRARAAARAPSC